MLSGGSAEVPCGHGANCHRQIEDQRERGHEVRHGERKEEGLERGNKKTDTWV